MAEAGLVDATLSDGKNESFTVINRLTDFGRILLLTLIDPSTFTPASLSPSPSPALKK